MSSEVSPGTFIPAWGGGIGIPTSGPRGGHLGGGNRAGKGGILNFGGKFSVCYACVRSGIYISHTHGWPGVPFRHEAPGLGFVGDFALRGRERSA